MVVWLTLLTSWRWQPWLKKKSYQNHHIGFKFTFKLCQNQICTNFSTTSLTLMSMRLNACIPLGMSFCLCTLRSVRILVVISLFEQLCFFCHDCNWNLHLILSTLTAEATTGTHPCKHMRVSSQLTTATLCVCLRILHLLNCLYASVLVYVCHLICNRNSQFL